MNPNFAFSASLVTSLVLWFPSMQACLRGDLDLTPAALRYLAALTASRLAINFLARLINAYRAGQVQHPELPGQDASAGASMPPSVAAAPGGSDPAAPHRRRSDRAVDDAADPAPLAA